MGRDKLDGQARKNKPLPSAAPAAEAGDDSRAQPVRALYARLAAAYATMPTVPDQGGGVSGDKYPL